MAADDSARAIYGMDDEIWVSQTPSQDNLDLRPHAIRYRSSTRLRSGHFVSVDLSSFDTAIADLLVIRISNNDQFLIINYRKSVHHCVAGKKLTNQKRDPQ